MLSGILLSACLLAAPARAVDIQIKKAKVDFKPGQSLWRLTYKLCVPKPGDDVAEWKYELRLLPDNGGNAIVVATKKFASPILAGHCVRASLLNVWVATQGLPPGRYRAGMWLGQRNGEGYVPLGQVDLGRDFVKK